MKKSILHNGMVLTGFALATTALIALTYTGTKDKIDQQLVQKRLSILNAIIPAQSYDNDIHHDCTYAVDKALLGTEQPHTVYLARNQNQPVAMAIETTAPNGYSGKIEIIVGVDLNGTVSGVRVLNHKETPGLGDKIELRVSDWISSFTGKMVTDKNINEWQVKKDGGQFDQFTGATITPRAVVSAVKNAVLYTKDNHTQLFKSDLSCEQTVSNEAQHDVVLDNES